MAQTSKNEDLKTRMTKALLQGEARAKYDKIPAQTFLLPWLDTVEIVSAEKLSDKMCKATFRFTVQPEFLNPYAYITRRSYFRHVRMCGDDLDSMAYCQTLGFWQSLGLCRTINFVYLRPAVEGEKCRRRKLQNEEEGEGLHA